MTGEPLPLLQLITTANSAEGARQLNRDVIAALRAYLARNVRQNRVPADERVQLEVLNPPRSAVLVAGRSITSSIIIALLALVASLVAVYVLENLYPSKLRRGGASSDPLHDLELDFQSTDSWEAAVREVERSKPAA
jgi:hypothetical protein